MAANATVGVASAAISVAANDHSQHPNFLHLAGLVCEAVLEVVFVALPGYLVAWTGMFDANSQRFVAELNVMVFTPCLIFTKLASQLNGDKLADLVIIPFIFATQTLVSWLCGQLMARLSGFSGPGKRRQRNFILAMAVFGNSNSLPISLVLSLSKTISGLHWAKVPGDNDDEVAARGILYLLIFQQLGQLLRWTWGYSVLLKPAAAYEEDERRAEAANTRWIEEGEYRDEPDDLIPNGKPATAHKTPDSGFSSGSQTPSTASDPLLGERARSTGHMTTFPHYNTAASNDFASDPTCQSWKTSLYRLRSRAGRVSHRATLAFTAAIERLLHRLPLPIQRALAAIHRYHVGFWRGVWRQMNPPLWAMLAALIVASIPRLQHLFFDPGTLINNSLTRAVSQSGGVAVPLILVVLGANLARSTLPRDQLATTAEEKREERALLRASIMARMVLPTLIMAPMLALAAKYAPVSIVGDPIFIIVCFLLTGAPSALQLAQICQVNGVFMGAMSNLLVASYVVAILPSTLVLVMLALEVLEWAQ
ncbi:hypothetical protein M433DRAFT_73224 [Acidomyces richmondensis BFW]|nr:MAG: hypothetical protein FE78DRAFT_136175 [Acidomyces sp. 'richmondensis']KYG42697.1 hypothetical protein M433DRAFT_73224 [Acidomyces richmondensis BFW]